MRFHTQTAGVSLTAPQPVNNVTRTAIEALAAVLGGTQSLHTNALDEVLALPSDHAARVALRTQQVIAEETGVTNVIDPLGGSWFVESLTDEIEEQCEEVFARIEEMSDDGTMRDRRGHRVGLVLLGNRRRCLLLPEPPRQGRLQDGGRQRLRGQR